MHQYALMHECLTWPAVQTLAYFLHVAGEPFGADVEDRRAPPDDDALAEVARACAETATRWRDDPIAGGSLHLVPGAAEEADSILQQAPDALSRVRRVTDLIDGFESPYGLELLATVHWVAANDLAAREGWETALSAIHARSPRKEWTFQPYHVQVAWTRLRAHDWL